MAVTGGCLCGAVRYRADADPLITRICWCRDCQKLGSGSATVNAMFPAEAVRIDGTLSDYESVADSGNIMHRGFCPKCGTPVTTASEARPALLGLRAGTFDDPGAVTPDVVIWTKSAPAWVEFDGKIPCHEGQPPQPLPSKG